MRKTVLLAFSVFLFGLNTAAAQQALEQLESFAPAALDLSAPAAYAVETDKKWDPDAPHSYYQNRGAVLSRENGVTLGNVRWGEVPLDHRSYVWKTALVKPEFLKKVYYGHKTKGVGHSFFVFVFEKGGFDSSEGEDGAAITVGAEGWTREPDGYNVLYGFMDRYPLIWNLTTFESYADFTVNAKHTALYLTDINISREQSRRLLNATFARIDGTNASGEFYHSVSNNCTTNPVALLNSVLPEEQRVNEEALGLVTPTASLPVLSVKKYRRLGVLSKESVKIDLSSLEGLDIRKL